MNIKQLRYVTSIISAGSFSAAAAREGVSVQAVSKAIGELEAEAAEPLFNRESTGVSPTALGKAFAVRARRVLKEYDALEAFVHGREGEPGSQVLHVGLCTPELPGYAGVKALISTVAERALRQPVEIIFTTGQTCIQQLRTGEFDFLITIGDLHEEGIVTGSLGTLYPSVLVGKESPLAELSEVTLDQINEHPVLLSDKFDHFNESVCRTYIARGLKSELVAVSTHRQLHEVLHECGGLSFLVGGNFLGPFDDSVIVPIAEKDRVAIPVCISSLPDSQINYIDMRHALEEIKFLA